MGLHSVCEVKPCSFNGVYQPSILNTFPSGGIIILSYFYDRISPLLPPPSPDQPTSFPISTIETLARQVCAGEQSWLTHWGPYPSALEELRDRPEHCLDLTFMHALLRLGYEFDEKREVRIEKKLDGVELGWALGAAIAMTEGELTCRV
jgi:guanosine-diphosphatase